MPWAGRLGQALDRECVSSSDKRKHCGRDRTLAVRTQHLRWKRIYLPFKIEHMGKAATMLSPFLGDCLGTQTSGNGAMECRHRVHLSE